MKNFFRKKKICIFSDVYISEKTVVIAGLVDSGSVTLLFSLVLCQPNLKERRHRGIKKKKGAETQKFERQKKCAPLIEKQLVAGKK